MNKSRTYALCMAVTCLLVLAGAICAGSAYAAPFDELINGTDPNKEYYCPNYSGELIERIVNCLVGFDTRDGVFIMIVRDFLTSQMAYMENIATGAVTLAIVLLGIKATIGMGGVTGLQRDTAILLLKIAGLLFFIDQAEWFFDSTLAIVRGMLEIVSTAANANLCPVPPTGTPNLWRQFDCLWDLVIGYAGSATVMGGAVGMIVAFVFSGPVGISIFFFALSTFLLIIFTVIRSVQIYVMAILGLGFMFLLSPIFVPMMLFRPTYNYFQKWLTVLMAYALTPVVMFAFMWFSVMAIDMALLSGSYSLWGTISGRQGNFGQPDFRIGHFMQGTYQETVAIGKTRSDVNPTEDDVDGTVQQTGVAGGTQKTRSIRSQTDDQYSQWVDATAVDLEALATKAGTAIGNVKEYIYSVLLSFVTSSLLLYVIFSMNTHIPNIVSQLVASSSAGAMAKSKVVGQQTTMAAVKAVRAAAGAKGIGK